MTSKPAEYRFQADVNARNIPELRRLYLHRPLGYPLSYAILAAAALGAGVFAFLSKSREAAFWVLVSAAIVYIGFALPKIAYARWSRQFAGNPVNGTVDGNGIYLHSHMQEFPWSQTVAAKISPKAALVYASKTDALPLQPEFFASEAEWHQVVALIQQRVQRVYMWGYKIPAKPVAASRPRQSRVARPRVMELEIELRKRLIIRLLRVLSRVREQKRVGR